MTPSQATERARRRRQFGADLLAVLAVTLVSVSVFALLPLPAHAHELDCAKQSGLQLARCERHQQMFAKCSAVAGEAHFACDREFLLANPLKCKALPLAADEARRCEAELAAFKTCEARPGREFMRCVRDTTKESPNG